MRAPLAHRLAWCLLFALAALGVACVGAMSGCATEPSTSPAALDPATPWVRHTIYAGLIGADGHALGDVDHDGDIDVAVAWEQSARATVSLQPADATQPWPTIQVATTQGCEAVALGDLDGDEHLDVVSVGQGKTVRVSFGNGDGTFAAAITVAVASTLQQWMAVAVVDTDGDGDAEIVAGGRVAYPARIVALHSGADPRDGATWTLEPIGPTGWTMSLVARDVDGDGDPDLLVSDRQWYSLAPPPAPRSYELQGVRWIERTATGWVSRPIGTPPAGQTARMLADGGSYVVTGYASDTTSASTVTAYAGWQGWAATPRPWPALGTYHAGAVADVDGDGLADLVVTSSAAGALGGVAWLRAPTWAPYVIEPGGVKFDGLDVVDLDRDGRLDVVTTEQTAGLGVVWHERP